MKMEMNVNVVIMFLEVVINPPKGFKQMSRLSQIAKSIFLGKFCKFTYLIKD